MDTLIAGEAWLLTLAERGAQEQRVAGRLLRMQILLVARTEHSLILGTEYTRRAICGSARYGAVAGIVVACSLCGAQAKLSAWERCALATSTVREEARREAVEGGHGHRALYLARCPGADYRRDTEASDKLPGGA